MKKGNRMLDNKLGLTSSTDLAREEERISKKKAAELFEQGILGSTLNILDISINVNTKYILFILSYFKDTFRNSKKGAAIPHLDKNLFKNLPIPLPPLAEQERIVAKIEEIKEIIDEIG